MFIFLRLLLAHYVGDFLLQSNYIFKLKQAGFKGVIPHALIIVLCCLALSWPFLHLPQMWFFIAFIGISHLIQDSIKVSHKNPKHNFWAYLLDQCFHAGAIALIFVTNLKDLQAPTFSDKNNILLRFYFNDHLIIYLIMLILATYNGYFLIRSFKDSFLNDAGRPDPLEKWYGIAERALMVSAFLAKSYFFLLLPAIMLIRPLLFLTWGNKLGISRDFIALSEILLSWGIAALCGSALILLQSGHSIN